MTCTLAGVAGAAGVAGVAGAGAGAAGGRGRRSQGRSRSQDGARMVVSAVLLAIAVGAALVLVIRDALSRGAGTGAGLGCERNVPLLPSVESNASDGSGTRGGSTGCYTSSWDVSPVGLALPREQVHGSVDEPAQQSSPPRPSGLVHADS